MKKMFAAIAALSLSAGVFAADAANPTNEARIAPAAPAHGVGSAHTMPERAGAMSMGSAQVRTPYGEVSSIHSNEATLYMDAPAPAPISRHTMEQTNELKLGPAAPAHGPESSRTVR